MTKPALARSAPEPGIAGGNRAEVSHAASRMLPSSRRAVPRARAGCFRGIAVVLECPMDIYRFDSDSTPSVSAFTSDLTGKNLPADYAPWRAVGGRVDLIGSPVARVVAEHGLFLLSG